MTKEKVKIVAVLALYVGFNFVLLTRHEMWRDEINVWLIGRDLSLIELFQEIGYQGHPCLWYLLIMPFAKLGFSARIMGIISLFLMTVTAGIYLTKAPIHFWIKALSLFGPIFTQQYSVNARGYCLVALLMMVLAWKNEKRNEHPIAYGLLLGLLVQADTIALATAGMISLMWLGESCWKSIQQKNGRPLRKAVSGLWIPLASLILWIAQFYHISDSTIISVQSLQIQELFTRSVDFGIWIMERLTGMTRPWVICTYVILFACGCILSIVNKTPWPICVVMATLIFQSVFSVLVYELYITHFILQCYVLIWMIWVFQQRKQEAGQSEKRKAIQQKTESVLQAVCLVLVVLMFIRWSSPQEAFGLRNGLKGTISDGEGAADYLLKNVSAKELIVTTNVPYTSTIWAFAEEYQPYFAGSGEVVSYADWSERQSREITFTELLAWITDRFPQKESFILIDTKGSYLLEAQDALQKAEILYQTSEATVKQEEYTIYRIELR